MMLDFLCGDVGYDSIITIDISLFLMENIGALLYFRGPETRHSHSPKLDMSYLFRALTVSSIITSRALHPYYLSFYHAVCIDRSPIITLCVPITGSLKGSLMYS